MIQVGIAGIGFMGMIHYLSYRKAEGVRVAALSEVNEKRLAGDWRDIQGNFGPRGEQMDLTGVKKYPRLDDMLNDPELDLIDICLPPHLHADAAVAALRKGKHVFCEKPMALTPAEARRMAKAADKAGRLLMIGHVLPLLPEFQFAYRAAASGEYGRPLGGHFKRVISDPQWLADFWNPEKIGGPMLDLHIHDAHFIRLLFGMPEAVSSRGRMRGEVVEYFTSQYEMDDPNLVVTAASGVIRQQGRSFTHGYEIHFEEATLVFEFAVVGGENRLMMPCTVLKADGSVEQPALGSGDPVDAFEIEIGEVLRSIRENRTAEFLRAELAEDAIVLCQKQTESVRKGRRVKIPRKKRKHAAE